MCPRSVCVVFAAAQLRCAGGARAPVSCTLLARGRWLVCVRARALRAASDVRARTLFVRAPSYSKTVGLQYFQSKTVGVEESKGA